MGGFLTDASLLRPFFTAAGMALLALVLALVFLPESRPVQEQNTKEKRAMRRGPLAVHAGKLGIRRLDQREAGQRYEQCPQVRRRGGRERGFICAAGRTLIPT